MTYKDRISAAMTELSKEPRVCFVGYNTKYGRAGGTLKEVPEDQLFEMPLAENLMAGAAIGMSLDGRIPVIWFERMDFLLCGLDAIVNHLDKLGTLSGGIHKPACILRICVGNRKVPLFTGPTHCQNFTEALRAMVSFPVVEVKQASLFASQYQIAMEFAKAGRSSAIIEFKDLYETV